MQQVDPPGTRLAPARGVLLLVGASLLVGLVVQGARGLYRPDEGRYVAVALRMLDTGDWISPELNHETPHFTKPPLTYWALASSLGVFGSTTWAARLPNTLAFAGTVLLMWGLGRRLTPARPWLPPALLALAAFPRVGAHVVTTDTLLTFCTTLTAYGFAVWRFDDARPARGLTLMWLGLALGFLTKGPPALLPLLAIVVFTAWQDGWRALRHLVRPSGLALFAVVGLGWYVRVSSLHEGLLQRFLSREVADRLLSGAHGRNSDPLYVLRVYVPVLLLGAFPWLLDAWRGLLHAGRALRAGGALESRFLACWFALPTVVLFVSPSRLPLYLLQVCPPLILLAALAAPSTRLRGPRSVAGVSALVLLGGVVFVGARWLPLADDTRPLAEAIQQQVPFTPREVLFLRKPHFGLALYLGCEVETVGFSHSVSENGTPIQSLAEELAEHEPKQLFLIEPGDVPSFEEHAARLESGLERCGASERFVFYAPHDLVRPGSGPVPPR